jgi:hypothetical protein
MGGTLMRRLLIAALALLGISGLGGCMNVARLGCEVKNFYLDVQTNIFGIDYPHGARQFPRERYFGVPGPGDQPICDD